MDIGPGAGEEGGHDICVGSPEKVASCQERRTAPYLARFLQKLDVLAENRRLANA